MSAAARILSNPNFITEVASLMKQYAEGEEVGVVLVLLDRKSQAMISNIADSEVVKMLLTNALEEAGRGPDVKMPIGKRSLQ